MKISEVVSFARNQTPSMPEALWRGRTMAIWGAVAGICLLYFFRARLSQLLFGASQIDPVTKPKVEDPTVSNSITYRSFEKELISFQQFVEIHAHQLSEWLQAEESSPGWSPRLAFCKSLMLDISGQITRIRQEGCEDTTWDSCKEQLVKLGSSDKGKEVCAELKNCLETLAKLNEQRMELMAQKQLPILCPWSFASYQEYVYYLVQDAGCAAPSEPSADARKQQKKETLNRLSKVEITTERIPQIYVKFFAPSFRKLRMCVCWDLVEKLQKQEEIYAELDMLYLIVKPLIGEIEELAQGSEEPVAQKLDQMKTRLFSLLGDPEYSKDIIQELEELDKERQVLQLESYAKKQGLLA